MVDHKSKKGTLKPVSQVIEIKEDETQLEVSIEGSNHLYGATIQIVPQDHEDDSSSSDQKTSVRGFHDFFSKVFSSRYALQATHVTSPKHMTKYMFSDLSAGKYQVKLVQPEKPKDCENAVDVLF